MPKVKISEFSSTPGNNTDIDGINIAENCPPSGINDAIRELMAQLKDWQSGTSNDPYVVGSSGSLTLSYGTANGVAYLNGSKVLTTGSALSFDGSGLGVNTAAVSGYKLTVGGTGNFFASASLGRVFLGDPTDTAGYVGLYRSDAGPANFNTGGNYLNFASLAGYTWNIGLAAYGSQSEQMRLTSTGLGIGTSSPSQKLSVAGNGSFTGWAGATGGGNGLRVDGVLMADRDQDNNVTLIGGSDNTLRLRTGSTTRATLDSSGNLLVGATSGGSGKLRVSGTSDGFNASYSSPSAAYFWSSNDGDSNCVEIYQGRFNKTGLTMSNNNTGTVTQIAFFQTGTQRGSITTDNSTTAYNTSSDYRLKENIAPMTGALAKVAALKPVTYTWKADGSAGEGFIAHELAEVCPAAVTGEKDAVDADGKPQYQGIDVSFLVGTLTAAIQEQQAIIQTLTARVAALESN